MTEVRKWVCPKSYVIISAMSVCPIILVRKQFIYTRRTNVLGNNYSCKIEEQVPSIFGKVKLLVLSLCKKDFDI